MPRFKSQCPNFERSALSLKYLSLSVGLTKLMSHSLDLLTHGLPAYQPLSQFPLRQQLSSVSSFIAPHLSKCQSLSFISDFCLSLSGKRYCLFFLLNNMAVHHEIVHQSSRLELPRTRSEGKARGGRLVPGCKS